MSKDIYLDAQNQLQIADTDVFQGANILNVQLGHLYYSPTTGIDLARFIAPDVSIQTQTFLSYAIQQLVQQGVRVETAEDITIKFIGDITLNVAAPEHGGQINV